MANRNLVTGQGKGRGFRRNVSLYPRTNFPSQTYPAPFDRYETTAYDDYGNFPTNSIRSLMDERPFSTARFSDLMKDNMVISEECAHEISQALMKDRLRQGPSRVPEIPQNRVPRFGGSLLSQPRIAPTFGGGGLLSQPRIAPVFRGSYSSQPRMGAPMIPAKRNRLPFPNPAASKKPKPSPVRPASAKTVGPSALKKKKKNKKRAYDQQKFSKPWVTDALKAEIEKKFSFLEIAKGAKTEDAWKTYRDQRNMCNDMFAALKLEYIGTHPEADVDDIMKSNKVRPTTTLEAQQTETANASKNEATTCIQNGETATADGAGSAETAK